MSDLNVQLVREFFEVNLFQVLTYWQHDTPEFGVVSRPSDSALQLFIENTRYDVSRRAGFLLESHDLTALDRAVVEVRAWHADRFYASVIDANPVLGHVASEESKALAARVLRTAAFETILVISELPASAEARERSVKLLQDLGVDHVIEFPAVLEGLLDRISAYGQYAPSSTLQTLRLIKRYNLVRRQQLEFAFPMGPLPAATPSVSAEATTETDDDSE